MLDCRNHIIYLPPPRADTGVLTTDPAQYLELLRQAAEVCLQDGRQGLPEDFDEWAREVEEHKLKHGAVAKRYGNSQTISYYGIQWRVENGIVDFQPCHRISGPIRKVHLAFCGIAPNDDQISPADIGHPTQLGYDPRDVEKLRLIAAETPPVPEDYDPQQGVVDLIAQMMLRALREQG